MKGKIAIIGLLICALLVGSVMVYADTFKIEPKNSVVNEVEGIVELIKPNYNFDSDYNLKEVTVQEKRLNNIQLQEEPKEEVVQENSIIKDNTNIIEENVINEVTKEETYIETISYQPMKYVQETQPTQTIETKIVEEPKQEYAEEIVEPVLEYKLTETEFEIPYDKSTMANEICEEVSITPEIAETQLTEEELYEIRVNNKVFTIDAAVVEPSVDGVEIEFEHLEPEVVVPKDTGAQFLGLPNKSGRPITVVGDDTFRNLNKLQSIIDSGNIVCYPSCDMTQGVKYLAGHNPGAMSHINTIKIGSVVRLSNKNCHQDYKVMERLQNVTGSFANARFSTTGYDAWTMLCRGTENALIIQFCVNGQNNLWYCRAIY